MGSGTRPNGRAGHEASAGKFTGTNAGDTDRCTSSDQRFSGARSCANRQHLRSTADFGCGRRFDATGDRPPRKRDANRWQAAIVA